MTNDAPWHPLFVFVVGVLVGMVCATVVAERAQRRTAQLLSTGRPDPARGDIGKTVVASPEATAMRHITEDSVARGAEQLLEHARAEGLPMTVKEARASAREMLAQANPLGGAH